ncbi:MAG: hypothetical protein MSG64_15770 [Pyrinomonadaceae bacterium MAG19_C2-C3]|nr:hypothetical protein [Pyrinomonadaceae bacterium MAG19_C2-C3]
MPSRVDSNQAEIVSALTDVGCGFPDIIVGGSMPCPCCAKKFKQSRLIEIKTTDGKLNKYQKEFHQVWNGQIAVARTIEEALRIVGIIK